jgi:kinetochore protein Mis13/DSN1
MFNRVKKKKAKELPRPDPIPEDEPEPPQAAGKKHKASPRAGASTAPVDQQPEPDIASKRSRKKMSFSTPDPTGKQSVRRSKRLSADLETTNLQHKTRRKDDDKTDAPERAVQTGSPLRMEKRRGPKAGTLVSDETEVGQSEGHSATKIALPVSDTPVIRRNKEMRENKGKKGERRSSLSLRGRRASSLIDSGSSNGKLVVSWIRRILTLCSSSP